VSDLGHRDPRHVALDISRVVSEAVARLARLDEVVQQLASPDRDHASRVEHVRTVMRGVRDLLRPIDMELWRAARASLAREDQEDRERAEAAKPAAIERDRGAPR
jgi:hypothetical protein